MKHERSVTSVIGIVLLIAIVLTGLAVIMYGGMLGLTESQDDIDLDSAERDLLAVQNEMENVAYGAQTYGQVGFANPDGDGNYRVDSDAGRIVIHVGGETELDVALGRLEYEQHDTRIAYQGGGVWRSNSGESSFYIQPPAMSHTDDAESSSYNFQIIQVVGDGQFSSGVSVSRTAANNIYSEISVSESDIVEIEIESEYIEAWERALEDRFNLSENQIAADPDVGALVATFGSSEELYLHFQHYAVNLS